MKQVKTILVISMLCSVCYGQETGKLFYGDAPVDHRTDTVASELLVADTSGNTMTIKAFCIQYVTISRRGKHTTRDGDVIYFNMNDLYSYATVGYLDKDKKPLSSIFTVWKSKVQDTREQIDGILNRFKP